MYTLRNENCCFATAGLRVWNSLPLQLRHQDVCFKTQLNNFFWLLVKSTVYKFTCSLLLTSVLWCLNCSLATHVTATLFFRPCTIASHFGIWFYCTSSRLKIRRRRLCWHVWQTCSIVLQCRNARQGPLLQKNLFRDYGKRTVSAIFMLLFFKRFSCTIYV